jgi:tripartite-type tricarboxylate transporter receptor subunit TctC
MKHCTQVRHPHWGAICSALVLFASLPADGADWPDRPIRIVAPFGPAGASDKFARVLAEYLPPELGQPVVIENRPGGGGLIGSAQVAHAEPDGYTLLISSLASQAVAPALSTNPGFDSLHDFTHITYLGGPPVAWVVGPASGMNSVADLMTRARQGDVASYASPGVGTLGHLVVEAATRQTGVRMTHVPYNTAALADIMAGRVPLASYAWSSVIGQVQAGTLRAIAISTAARQPDFPDVPTFKEQGFDIVANMWFALSGPAHMREDVVARLNREVCRILERPDVRARFAHDAIEFKQLTPDELAALFATEIERWGAVVRTLHTTGLTRG